MIIDGKKASALLREKLKEKVSKLQSTYNAVPGLTVILVGEDPPSKIYVKNKEKSAIEIGINSETGEHVLTHDDIINVIKKLIDIKNGHDVVDDVDTLANRRVRAIG